MSETFARLDTAGFHFIFRFQRDVITGVYPPLLALSSGFSDILSRRELSFFLLPFLPHMRSVENSRQGFRNGFRADCLLGGLTWKWDLIRPSEEREGGYFGGVLMGRYLPLRP